MATTKASPKDKAYFSLILKLVDAEKRARSLGLVDTATLINKAIIEAKL